MTSKKTETMKAVAIDRFGGPDELRVQTLPVPELDPTEVLIRVAVAGVGPWDPFEREGGYAEMSGMDPEFPYVLGSEGAGTVAGVGDDVGGIAEGNAVYASGFLNPKGGFYAEYVAVSADLVCAVPATMTVKEAGVVSGVGLTALRGLEDTLNIQAGESVMIFGASGGMGHLAVQLAKRKGARVAAVASGEDGVALARELGADAAVDGHGGEVVARLRAFAPEGLDSALLTAGGEVAQEALSVLRDGGRIAYPNGVRPEPVATSGQVMRSYNGEPDQDILQRLDHRMRSGPFSVHVARTFPLDGAAEAHEALRHHYLGKLALRVREP